MMDWSWVELERQMMDLKRDITVPSPATGESTEGGSLQGQGGQNRTVEEKFQACLALLDTLRAQQQQNHHDHHGKHEGHRHIQSASSNASSLSAEEPFFITRSASTRETLDSNPEGIKSCDEMRACVSWNNCSLPPQKTKTKHNKHRGYSDNTHQHGNHHNSLETSAVEWEERNSNGSCGPPCFHRIHSEELQTPFQKQKNQVRTAVLSRIDRNSSKTITSDKQLFVNHGAFTDSSNLSSQKGVDQDSGCACSPETSTKLIKVANHRNGHSEIHAEIAHHIPKSYQNPFENHSIKNCLDNHESELDCENGSVLCSCRSKTMTSFSPNHHEKRRNSLDCDNLRQFWDRGHQHLRMSNIIVHNEPSNNVQCSCGGSSQTTNDDDDQENDNYKVNDNNYDYTYDDCDASKSQENECCCDCEDYCSLSLCSDGQDSDSSCSCCSCSDISVASEGTQTEHFNLYYESVQEEKEAEENDCCCTCEFSPSRSLDPSKTPIQLPPVPPVRQHSNNHSQPSDVITRKHFSTFNPPIQQSPRQTPLPPSSHFNRRSYSNEIYSLTPHCEDQVVTTNLDYCVDSYTDYEEATLRPQKHQKIDSNPLEVFIEHPIPNNRNSFLSTFAGSQSGNAPVARCTLSIDTDTLYQKQYSNEQALRNQCNMQSFNSITTPSCNGSWGTKSAINNNPYCSPMVARRLLAHQTHSSSHSLVRTRYGSLDNINETMEQHDDSLSETSTDFQTAGETLNIGKSDTLTKKMKNKWRMMRRAIKRAPSLRKNSKD